MYLAIDLRGPTIYVASFEGLEKIETKTEKGNTSLALPPRGAMMKFASQGIDRDLAKILESDAFVCSGRPIDAVGAVALLSSIPLADILLHHYRANVTVVEGRDASRDAYDFYGQDEVAAMGDETGLYYALAAIHQGQTDEAG